MTPTELFNIWQSKIAISNAKVQADLDAAADVAAKQAALNAAVNVKAQTAAAVVAANAERDSALADLIAELNAILNPPPPPPPAPGPTAVLALAVDTAPPDTGTKIRFDPAGSASGDDSQIDGECRVYRAGETPAAGWPAWSEGGVLNPHVVDVASTLGLTTAGDYVAWLRVSQRSDGQAAVFEVPFQIVQDQDTQALSVAVG